MEATVAPRGPGDGVNSPVVVCEPQKECKDPNVNRWYCMRGHSLDDGPGEPGVCPLAVCIRRGANP